MNWFGGIVSIALKSLWANKLRTALTTIGVIIGIGTIIGMLSLINGINQSVMLEFKKLGPNVVYITRDEPGIHVRMGGKRERKEITFEETGNLRRRCASIERLSIVSDQRGQVAFKGRRSGTVTIRGVSTDYADVGKVAVDQGRFFSDAEDRKSMVCVLGAGVVEGIFGKTSPLGKEVEIEGRRFTVVGTLEATGVVFGMSSDNVALIPYRAARVIFGDSRLDMSHEDMVMALPRPGVTVEQAIDDLRVTLRVIRKIRPGDEDTFALSNQQSLLDTYNKLTGSIYWVMRIVASIALLVSGIGIMNIMLVVVMERTGDRPEEGHRGDQEGDHGAVSRRSGCADVDRRGCGDRSRVPDPRGRGRWNPASGQCAHVGRTDGARHLLRRWHILRRLPGLKGLGARPGGGIAL